MFTVRARSPSVAPFIACIAFCASSGVDIVTKAKPRERPLVRSIMRLASTTVPWAANASCKSFSVVLKERFPTNSFVLIFDDLLFKTNRFSGLSPTIGFQIITEPSSLEDLP